MKDSNRLGMHTHMPLSNVAFDKSFGVHAGWVRISFNFIGIEPQEGVFQWQNADSAVYSATQRNLKIYGSLAYAPPWAREKDVGINSIPKILPWKEFISAVVSRYSNTVKHWGIWNEPNNRPYFAGTKEDYVFKVLKPAAQVIRTANPSLNLKICAPDLYVCGLFSSWQNYLRYVMGTSYNDVDIITVHRYDDTASGTIRMFDGWTWPVIEGKNIKDLTEDWRKNGKEVWDTETGWESKNNESYQAKNYLDFLKWYENVLWLKNMIFYEIIDSANENRTFGLVDKIGHNKLAFDVVKTWMET